MNYRYKLCINRDEPGGKYICESEVCQGNVALGMNPETEAHLISLKQFQKPIGLIFSNRINVELRMTKL